PSRPAYPNLRPEFNVQGLALPPEGRAPRRALRRSRRGASSASTPPRPRPRAAPGRRGPETGGARVTGEWGDTAASKRKPKRRRLGRFDADLSAQIDWAVIRMEEATAPAVAATWREVLLDLLD